MSRITTAAEQIAVSGVGKLPQHGERAPVVRMKQSRIRAIVGQHSFFVRGAAALNGQEFMIDSDDAAGLIARGLAELVQS